MTHFICTGECKGMSDHPGTCQDEACSKHDEALEHCECDDGKHNGRQDIDEKNEEGKK